MNPFKMQLGVVTPFTALNELMPWERKGLGQPIQLKEPIVCCVLHMVLREEMSGSAQTVEKEKTIEQAEHFN